jgi:hypothetical protein
MAISMAYLVKWQIDRIVELAKQGIVLDAKGEQFSPEIFKKAIKSVMINSRVPNDFHRKAIILVSPSRYYNYDCFMDEFAMEFDLPLERSLEIRAMRDMLSGMVVEDGMPDDFVIVFSPDNLLLYPYLAEKDKDAIMFHRPKEVVLITNVAQV